MTDEQCEKQIEVLHKAAKEALKSRESALQFLIDAGIVRIDERRQENFQTNKEYKK